MKNNHCIIMTTTGSPEEADRLAEMLVEKRLAACVQTTPITSTYTWQGQLTRECEWLLLIKTQKVNYQNVHDALLEAHSYDTPEIIEIPITQGSQTYLAWINTQTSP